MTLGFNSETSIFGLSVLKKVVRKRIVFKKLKIDAETMLSHTLIQIENSFLAIFSPSKS